MPLLLATTSPLAARTNNTIRYADPAAWVQPPPEPTDAATPAGLPFRFIYSDTQVRVDETGIATYTAYRARIIKPEALQLGQVGLVWSPASGDATVHRVRIIRDGQAIDALKTTRFQVIQREGALEQSVLTGNLTATLQIPGLRVGDEVEVATTMRGRDPTLGDKAFGLFQLPPQGLPGAFRFQLSWPDSAKLSFQSSRDLASAVPARHGRNQTISFELRDPNGVIVNDGAPDRFNMRRLIEYSNFSGWPDVSQRFWPLYSQAALLPSNSPLQGKVAGIKASSSDPAVRALAALQLVQDEIRYVYVGLNGGNLRPAPIEETWSRRFGDCKAKTAMLLALLTALDIEAEAVLVGLNGDDGLDARLPSIGVFNHVLVRARIGDKNYWLDGTRLGDRNLDMLPQPGFNWGLPVRQAGAPIEPVKAEAFARPQFIGVLDLDASAGFDKPAKASVKYVFRGDEAYSIRSGLAGLAGEDADRVLRSYWRREESWIDSASVAWHYDEAHKNITLSLAGTAKPDWDGNDKDGHSLTIWGAGFSPPDTLRRAKEQDGTAPWLTDFPKFKCWATTIRLPLPGSKRHWTYSADAMNRQIGGVTYWRQAALQGDLVRTVMSRNVKLREITADQARAQTDAIAGFNNNMSSVFEQASSGNSAHPAASKSRLPFGDNVDWAVDDRACIAAPGK